MRYKQKGPLSVNLQKQGKQCTGLHKLPQILHKWPHIPCYFSKHFLYDKQRRIQGVCDGRTE